jgi:hypothetical protein
MFTRQLTGGTASATPRRRIHRVAHRSVFTMLTTHESMRLPRLTGAGFSFWRAVELTGSVPHFLLTVEYPRPAGQLDLLFGIDQEVVSFLNGQETATPLALQVLFRKEWTGSRGWQMARVMRLEVRRAVESTDQFNVLYLTGGPALRGRDLAPVAVDDTRPVAVFEFPNPVES